MDLNNIPKPIINIVNQVFDMEKKLELMPNNRSLMRNISRIKSQLSAMNIGYRNPLGEKYNETRTDCEATITGDSTTNLRISEVIKPIIFVTQEQSQFIIQNAVVIVQGK